MHGLTPIVHHLMPEDSKKTTSVAFGVITRGHDEAGSIIRLWFPKIGHGSATWQIRLTL